MVRLFSQLVNLDIKVFITTHSDYIIKELNTLIMLNHENPEPGIEARSFDATIDKMNRIQEEIIWGEE